MFNNDFTGYEITQDCKASILVHCPFNVNSYKEYIHLATYPVKMLLQDLARKGPVFLHPCKILQDPAGSCGILRDFAGILQDSCTKFLQDSCKILQDPTRSCKILQGCKKKDLLLQDLAKAFLLGT